MKKNSDVVEVIKFTLIWLLNNYVKVKRAVWKEVEMLPKPIQLMVSEQIKNISYFSLYIISFISLSVLSTKSEVAAHPRNE